MDSSSLIIGGNHTIPMNQGMYGNNFIDILFKHVMDKGITELSFLFFIQLYFYLSLDKIKDLFQYINNKISNYFHDRIENWFSQLSVYITYIATNTVYRGFSWGKHKFHFMFTTQSEEDEPSPPELNKFKVTLGTDSVDLQALSHYLIRFRDRINLINSCHRHDSSIKSVTETFIVPGFINLEDDPVNISLEQDIDFSFSFETSGSQEKFSFCSYSTKAEKKTIVCSDLSDFSNRSGMESIDVHIPIYGGMPSWFTCLKNWSCTPRVFFNGLLYKLLILIIYTNDKNAYENLLKFVEFGNTICINGLEYVMRENYAYLNWGIPKEEMISTLLKEFAVYQPRFKQYYDTLITKETIKKLHELDNRIFNHKRDNEIKLIFEHLEKTPFELSNYARNWMDRRISEYYEENNKHRIGDKISVFKLHIEYDMQTIEEPNPEFNEWLKKKGLSEEEYDEKKITDKKKRKEKKSKKKSSTRSSSGGEEEELSDDSSISDLDMPPTHNFGVYGMGFHNYHKFNYPPPKTIKKDKPVPKVSCKLIKKDRKPLEYLYLPDDKMTKLSNYLYNFKENREHYEKYGFPYRGGILLSGEPGCGKSSTILAAATFLGKDIFYLDLGQLSTNTELKLCIDFIKLNSQNGGMIIFEDIDCMTDLVLERSTNILPVKKKKDLGDSLSLSYLLNVIDGTMAPENVIFVMTTNHENKLDKALIRPGRIDIKITLNKCTRYQLSKIYYDLFGENLSEQLLQRFPEDKFITAKVILHLFHNSFTKNVNPEKLLEPFIDPPCEIITNYNT